MGLLVAFGACFSLIAGMGIAGSTPITRGVGFETDDPPMLKAVSESATVQPIITVGEELRDGYMFESIPDGIALASRGEGRVQVYVNHETSTVPFPLVPGDPEASLTDFHECNAQQATVVVEQERGGRCPARRVRNSERGQLPALLLELPRGPKRGVRSAVVVHQ